MLVFSNFSNLIQAPYFLKIAVPSKLLISSKSTFHFDSQFHLMLCNQSHFVLCKQQIHHKMGNMYVAPLIPLLQTMDHKASGKHCQHLSLELPHSVPMCLELCCTSHSFLLSNIWHFLLVIKSTTLRDSSPLLSASVLSLKFYIPIQSSGKHCRALCPHPSSDTPFCSASSAIAQFSDFIMCCNPPSSFSPPNFDGIPNSK